MVREAFRNIALPPANRTAMLDTKAIEDEECFIPRAHHDRFLDEIGRQTASVSSSS